MIASVLGPMLAGLFGGGGSDQPRQSFEGTAVDPKFMMGNASTVLNRLGQALSDRAASPVGTPSAFAQTPGAYSGGGLPFPIGLVAQDPALANPSLLNRPGMGEFQNLFSGITSSNPNAGYPDAPSYSTPTGAGATGGESVVPFDVYANDPDGPLGPQDSMGENAFRDFYMPSFDQGTTSDGQEPTRGNPSEARSGPRRRSDVNDGEYGQLVRATDLAPEGDDDLSRGMGAINLLLEAYGMR